MSFVACGPKLAGLLEDLFRSSHLDNPSLLQAIDPVTVLDRCQSVGAQADLLILRKADDDVVDAP